VLAEIVQAERDPDLSRGLGDALVAAAVEQPDAADLARRRAYRRVQAQLAHLVHWITTAEPLELVDLEQLQAALDARRRALESERAEQERRERREAAAGRRRLRRVGSGWLDHKLITDRATGKVYGPYSYYRYRAGGRHRSLYVGKAVPRA
jgi:DNA-binding helix-hairpin-helix protein with protein kinase domain